MAEYNPELPSITLLGTVSGNAVGKTKYGVSDTTGLGPNGADKYIEYNVTITSITAQSLGDASVRDSLGLNVGGQYTGIDVKEIFLPLLMVLKYLKLLLYHQNQINLYL